MHKSTVVYYINMLYHAKAFLAKVLFILVITCMHVNFDSSEKKNPHFIEMNQILGCEEILEGYR